MVADVRKITELREQVRNSMTQEGRQTLALEQIADTLEAIRIEFIGYTNMVGRLQSTRSGYSDNPGPGR